MKSILLSIAVALALVQTTRADDVTVKIKDVHLCCDSCVKGVAKALEGIDGVKAACDKTEKTVTLTASDTATAQKAADALVKAGFFGEADSGIKMDATTGAKGEKVQTLKIEGVHMCCPKCVKGFNAAIKDVAGVTTNDCVKNAKVITVTGDFKDSDLLDALQKAGFTGKVMAQ
jgi:copper chaperone CopZ